MNKKMNTENLNDTLCYEVDLDFIRAMLGKKGYDEVFFIALEQAKKKCLDDGIKKTMDIWRVSLCYQTTILMANWKRQNISQLDTEYERLGDVVLYCDKEYRWGLDRVGGIKI